ncbi:alpha/beta fold hydrolase [Demequina soli]|uniref:alpha/beta fold hydrolase n=1 Tax=Demequina soli TaxID=1638987 RepID=UPI0007866351|nr:alpha/beta hydrolase [Demequina soli]
MTLAPLSRFRSHSHRDDALYREAERAAWAAYGMAPEERWVDVAELGIRVRTLVHGEGRPVVFVHGTPTAGNVFIPLVARLEGVRAIVVDRPGCALSDPLDYTDMTPEDLRVSVATYLAAVIRELAGGPVDLLGNSAGGMAVLVAAARLPDLVRSVVVEGVPAIQGMHLPRPLRLGSMRPVAQIVTRHPMSEAELRRSFRLMGHADLIAQGRLTEPEIAWRTALNRATDTLKNELALMARVATWRGLRPGWVAGKETLEAIQAPSLWVVGDLDPFASPERVRAWAAHARGSTVVVRERSGHQPWLDAPGEHARLLADWWEQTSR